ncbi:MAG: peptidoglycan DD-metalloendopeptidase family protein [Flavobacteriaceae bacterium]
MMLLTCSLGFSQMQTGNYDQAANDVMVLYNIADYNGIFELFDVEMKKALPKEQTSRFFAQNVNAPMGAIKKMEYNRSDAGAYYYRTYFEKAIADMVISLNPQNQINGLRFQPVRTLQAPILERNITKISLPFREEWFVYWGGTQVEQNYHVAEISQQYAYDLLMVENGSSHRGEGTKNEDYLVYGKDVIAPCDGRVVQVIEGVSDNIPGKTNPEQLTGNTVVLRTDAEEFVLFAHLKKSSIKVEEGQDVRRGEVLAQCGNSGNSTEPHLHLSLQNQIDMDGATGAKLYFDRLLVNGEPRQDFLPVKEDFIKNLE